MKKLRNLRKRALPSVEQIKVLMNSRLLAIKKRTKEKNGLASYPFDKKRRLLTTDNRQLKADNR